MSPAVHDLPFEKAKDLSRDLADHLGAHGISDGVFTDWAHGDHERSSLLAGTVWGLIQWERALGRPDGPTLSNGFHVVHQGKTAEFESGPAGQVDKGTWITLDDVVVYDLPDDGTLHRVGFTCLGRAPTLISDESITPSLVVDHRWVDVLARRVDGSPLQLAIRPFTRQWSSLHDRATVCGPFTVA